MHEAKEREEEEKKKEKKSVPVIQPCKRAIPFTRPRPPLPDTVALEGLGLVAPANLWVVEVGVHAAALETVTPVPVLTGPYVAVWIAGGTRKKEAVSDCEG